MKQKHMAVEIFSIAAVAAWQGSASLVPPSAFAPLHRGACKRIACHEAIRVDDDD